MKVLIKSLSIILVFSLLFSLLVFPETNLLGGLVPKPSTWVDSGYVGCFGSLYLEESIPTSLETILLAIFIFLFLLIYLYHFIPKLPNGVRESTVRHETINTKYE